jgi:uncharacterized membrane protein YdjX (TVP38/TMEM64 family)
LVTVAATDPKARASPSRQGQWELAAGLAAIVLGVVLILVVPPFRHCVGLVLHGKFGSLRSYIRSLGAGGFALLLGLMVAHAIVFYPSEIITATAGYVYGFAAGLAFVVGGWLLAALFSYALGRTVARPLLRRVLGTRFVRLERGMERGGIPLLLSARLVPIVPFALVGYAAGATHTNLWRFAWTTVLGYLPLTVAVVYLGSKARTFSTGDPLVWVAVAVLVGLLAGEWIYERRRTRRERAPGPD